MAKEDTPNPGLPSARREIPKKPRYLGLNLATFASGKSEMPTKKRFTPVGTMGVKRGTRNRIRELSLVLPISILFNSSTVIVSFTASCLEIEN
jgi:hypothetical protein